MILPQHMFEQTSGKSVQRNCIPLAWGGDRSSILTPNWLKGLAWVNPAKARMTGTDRVVESMIAGIVEAI